MIGFVGAPLASFRPSFSGAAVSSRSNTSSHNVTSMVSSKALPWMEAPTTLPDAPGNFGFDPLGMSANMDQGYQQAAEIKNGRVAMLGVLGMLVQNVIHLPSGAYSNPNPIAAIYSVPEAAWIQIIAGISLIELVQFKKTFANGAALGFDPLGMGKTPGKWAAAEIINGRLAMLGSIGLISQTLQTGKSPLEQLTGIF